MSIKPGITVEINLDPSSEHAECLKAVIYDVRGKRLVVSQTSPPLRPPFPQETVDISYIIREGNSARRYGFSALISGFCDDYALSTGMRVPTVILEMNGRPEETSLRKGFRIRTPSKSGLSLAIQAGDYPIFDISLTGVNFIQSCLQQPFKPSTVLDCRLNIDGRDFPLRARVIRTVETATARHVAAVFVNPGQELQPVLSRKILELERADLSRYG